MLKQLLNGTIYVRIGKNQIRVRHIEDKKDAVVSPAESFTTTRQLVGKLAVAEKCLKQGIKKVYQGRWLSASPVIVIHPLEMVEGGLSQVEERVLMELAAGAGARKVVVWVGHELSDNEVVTHAANV